MSGIEPRRSGRSLGRAFRRDRADGKVAGVCAGIADYFETDPLLVRAVFVIGTLVGFGSFLLIYLAIWLLAD